METGATRAASRFVAACSAGRFGELALVFPNHQSGNPTIVNLLRPAIPAWQSRSTLAHVGAGSYNSLSCIIKIFAAFR
jgi:hypothetical protein